MAVEDEGFERGGLERADGEQENDGTDGETK